MTADVRRLFLLPRDSWWPLSETGCERRILSLPDPRHGRSRKYLLEVGGAAAAPRLLEVQQVAHPSPSSWFVDQAVLSGTFLPPNRFRSRQSRRSNLHNSSTHLTTRRLLCRWLRTRRHARRHSILASSAYGTAHSTWASFLSRGAAQRGGSCNIQHCGSEGLAAYPSDEPPGSVRGCVRRSVRCGLFGCCWVRGLVGCAAAEIQAVNEQSNDCAARTSGSRGAVCSRARIKGSRCSASGAELFLCGVPYCCCSTCGSRG